MEVDIVGTPVLEWTLDAVASRVIVHQGGTRSSKTFSLCQYIITRCLQETIQVTVARYKLTWLKASALKDFLEVLEITGLHSRVKHNKSENIFTFQDSGSIVSFIGLDESDKLRGRKQDIMWFNEANECRHEDFKQAAWRTQQQLILDFNPSDEFHWIYDHVLTRKDCTFIQSTYMDNTFLSDELKREIETLKTTDPDYWQVFGLGNRGVSRELIYPHWSPFHEMPEGGNVCYGLDFGYNDPCALVKCRYKDGTLHVEQLIYESYLTTADLKQRLSQLVSRRDVIKADGSRPEIIEELKRAGFNISAANKAIKDGIDKVKTQQLLLHADSVNLIKEARHYKWRKHSDGRTLDEPVDLFNHAMDAMRYAAMEIVVKKGGGIRSSLVRNG